MYQIRIAENKNDALSASRIYAISWKSAYKDIFSEKLLSEITFDFWVESFVSNFETHRYKVAILSFNGKDVGAGGYGFSRDYQNNEWGEITSIYFLPEVWGEGLSGQLLDFMVNDLRELGYLKIHLWVLSDNLRAQRFYEKCGFYRTGNERVISFKGEEKSEIEYALM